jgi:hypothetical protein
MVCAALIVSVEWLALMGWIVHVDRPVDSGPYARSMTRATVPSIQPGQSPHDRGLAGGCAQAGEVTELS